MGQRILLSCDVCGCKKEMSVGAGLMSRNAEVAASCLGEEDAGEWRQLYGQGRVSFFRSKQKVFYCERCKDLVCQLVVEAELTDGSKITLGDRCQTCRGELDEVDLEMHHMICPICKKGDLSWKQVGLWD